MREALFNFVLTPNMAVRRTQFDGGTLGGSFLSKAGKTLKKGMAYHRKTMRKVWNKTVPKPIRKVFTRKNFIKYAPILAGAAQILNIIPGLGIAVSLAILAGAAAVAVADTVAVKKQMKADQKKMDAKTAKEANSAFLGSKDMIFQRYGVTYEQFRPLKLPEKLQFLQMVTDDASGYSLSGLGAIDKGDALADAAGKADHAFTLSQGYFTEKYGITEEQFRAMDLEGKLNFLQVAVEDAKQESEAGQPPYDTQETVEIEPAAAPEEAPAPSAAAPAQPAAAVSPSGSMGVGTWLLIGLGILAFSRR